MVTVFGRGMFGGVAGKSVGKEVMSVTSAGETGANKVVMGSVFEVGDMKTRNAVLLAERVESDRGQDEVNLLISTISSTLAEFTKRSDRLNEVFPKGISAEMFIDLVLLATKENETEEEKAIWTIFKEYVEFEKEGFVNFVGANDWRSKKVSNIVSLIQNINSLLGVEFAKEFLEIISAKELEIERQQKLEAERKANEERISCSRRLVLDSIEKLLRHKMPKGIVYVEQVDLDQIIELIIGKIKTRELPQEQEKKGEEK